MTEGLHEISQAIGRLQAEADSSQRQRSLIFEKLDEINDKLTPLASLPAHIKSHCDHLDKLNNYVQRFKGVMWSGRFVWAAVLVLAGAGWALFKEYKAENDTRINRIERSMPRSLYPDSRP